MPDNQFSYYSELEHYFSGSTSEFAMRTRTSAYVKKENRSIPSVMSNAKRCHADRAFDICEAATSTALMQSPKKSRAKPESSQHFGVRFRPDLQKWVAEIRVAEWKTVDKKVWLGTFDSEEGAARAVDAARKLLQCKKKRPPNFPCDELTAYAERIPAALNLNNLRNESMFKEVTLFVKRKAQEYAAGFCPDKSTTAVASCISIAADQIPAKYTTSEMETISFGTTSSSAGTSPGESSWFDPSFEIGSYPYVEEQPCVDDVGGWTNLQTDQNRDNWELDMDTVSYECYNQLLFPNEIAEATMDHDMMYNVESQNQTYSIGDAALPDWTQQSTFNSYHSSMLMSSMDYTSTQVC